MPARLANESYRHVRLGPEDGRHLNLSWTQDERPLVDVDVDGLVRRCLDESCADPAGGDPSTATADLAVAVAGHLGLSPGDFVLRTAAGVIGLLHALARLPQATSIACAGEVYPDFPCWAAGRGARAVPWAAVDRGTPASVVLVDRPGLVDGRYDDLDALAALCRRVAGAGGIVVVDESYGNYRPPSFSAAALLPTDPNLVVLRGVSKGYGLGSLRIGLALVARPLDAVVGLVPDGTVSTLSLRVATALLGAGDVTGGVRAAIDRNGPRFDRLLGALAGPEPVVRRPGMPHAFVGTGTGTGTGIGTGTGEPGLAGRLAAVGVHGKIHHSWCGDTLDEVRRFRLAVPLRPDRMDDLLRRTGAPTRPDQSGTSQPEVRNASSRTSVSAGSSGRSSP